MSNPNDYTIGWICALPTEYVAAQAFLDGKHERPEYLSPNDNNHYTLGKVGKHNVVIAVLPDGEYGTSSAASVAKDMLHSFHNIRIGLMVGIGGGAPSPEHDIRLGDIVVSVARNGKGGVFQYDFGKVIQNQSFRQTGFLNQPPAVLRAAVSGLKTQYEIEGHHIEEAINNILEKRPRLRKKYQRPDHSSDNLFQSWVTHPPDVKASCTAVCANDPSNLVTRHERVQNEDNPAVHYGLIASANQLMRHASLRDKFAKEHEVLCFEMEAAGLMNQFPCLVIRGICDYSDTHKNEEWQGYAAMTATAFAKDLLYQIAPNKVETEKRISDILSSVHDALSGTRANVESMRSKLDRNEDLKILDWLTPVDYGPQQADFIKRRHEGTGTWLLHKNEFNTWLNNGGKTLYCSGNPGTGKTILTSIVVHELSSKHRTDMGVGIAYLYCNFRRQQQQKSEDLLSSLLKQLIQKRASVPEGVRSLYGRHSLERTRPSFNEIIEALESVATLYSRVFILVDALDECGVSHGERQKFLSAIFNLQEKTRSNLLATSRVNDNIKRLFEGALSLQIRATTEDVDSYLDGQMSFLQSDIVDETLRSMIKREIVSVVDGMFLLAQLHMNNLMDQPTKGDVKQALRHLSKGLDGLDKTYDQAMERIEDQGCRSRKLAKRILEWIILAERPLSTTELRHALAVRPSTEMLDEDYLPSVEVLTSVCAGLVTVAEHSGIVRLVHYTTQEYFERKWTSLFPNAQANITKDCVTYLAYNVFETGFCHADEDFKSRLQTHALYDYAARNWGHHARIALMEEDLILEFLKSGAKASAASQAIMAPRGYYLGYHGIRGYRQSVPKQMTALHISAYFGLAWATAVLLEDGYDLHLQDSHGRTPLSWAAEKGHEAVVKLLLENGAELESEDNLHQTPLLLAAQEGYEAIVKLLLENGAELESQGGFYQTPLSQAAEEGHEAVVKLLLENGAELESKDGYYKTPLSRAAEAGHEAVVKLLLENGAELESKDGYQKTPLSWAAKKGHEAVVRLLLEKGAELEPKDGFDRTPLSLAAEMGHEAVVKLLLEKGAELDIKDVWGKTPLLGAVERGHEPVIKLLIEKGADLDCADCEGQTPRLLDIEMGHRGIVELLAVKQERGNVSRKRRLHHIST